MSRSFKYYCPHVRSLLAIVLFSALATAGCVGNRQYRSASVVAVVDTRRSTDYTGTSNACIEVGADYTLGFVELDDQGWLWERKQVDAITNRFTEELKTNGLIIVTFVHGWMHNAEPDDTNLKDFRAHMLSPLAAMEEVSAEVQHRPPRRVVGVYVGWRGRSSNLPLLGLTTFWSRKSAAERVGHGGIVELLCELEKLRDFDNSTHMASQKHGLRGTSKMITIGHSFGGDVVYSAAAPVLVQRMIETEQVGTESEAPQSLGDLVVLINPAFEAARFETIHRLAAASPYPQTNCTLVIFTSKSDLATKVAFPAGRFVSTLGQSHRNGEQANANRTAIGHYSPYIGFDLIAADKTDIARRRGLSKLYTAYNQLQKHSDGTPFQKEEAFYFKYGVLKCRPTAAHSGSVFVVAVDPKLVPDHSSIDQGDFLRCVTEFAVVFAAGNH